MASTRHARFLRFPQRRQGIRGLARLADHHDQRAWRQDRVSVTVFGGHVHLHRNARQLLDDVLADQPGMIRRAAGDNMDAFDLPDLLRRQGDFPGEIRLSVLDPSGEGVADRPGLLVDLLQHEMIVSAFFRRDHIPVHPKRFPLDGLSVRLHQADIVPGEHGHLPVIQE